MPTIVRFEEMEAWQTARELTRAVYNLSHDGKLAKDFCLSDQMRRASISIMSNISEGFENRTQALFKDFLGRAKASAGELRAQIYIARDVEYLNNADYEKLFDLCDKCSRQIARFIQYLSRQPNIIREEGIIYDA